LAIANDIVHRYADHPFCVQSERVFLISSNQKMIVHLKEIADLCGITKHLTFHIAGHTYVTTVTLGNGILIESVSKMLFRADIRTTQIGMTSGFT